MDNTGYIDYADGEEPNRVSLIEWAFPTFFSYLYFALLFGGGIAFVMAMS